MTLGKGNFFAECHLGHSVKNPPGRVPMSAVCDAGLDSNSNRMYITQGRMSYRRTNLELLYVML
jgi:hypothetical protein